MFSQDGHTMSKFPDKNPEAILRKALRGDIESFWELMQPHERTIHAVALGILKDPEKAQDVVHDVYVRAFSTLGNLRSPSKLSSWLYTMARNIAHEHQRKEIRDEKFPKNMPPQVVISVPDMLIEEEEFQALEAAMETLPEAHRIVLGLKYMNNMSCREIADTLGIGIEAAKSRLFEARRVLRIRMKAAEKKAATRPATFGRGEQNFPEIREEKKVL
jgi:RNA polymerase sigma-70 factor (ECF subfamily)